MPKLAVIGHPVAHSRSPAMQTAALEALGLGREWSYGAVDLTPERFADGVAELAREGYAGVNVTVPHKAAALELAATASPAARQIGAANVLSFEAGRVAAENTDAAAIVAVLGADPSGSRALVLGAGGSARAAAWALSRAGADVSVHNRTPARAAELAADLGDGVRVLELARADSALPLSEFDVLVNATTVGMASANAASEDYGSRDADLKGLGVDADALTEGLTVIDLVYGRRPTGLIAAASEGGARTSDGIEVLVAQGAAALRIWTGIDPPIAEMERAARAT